MKIKDILKDYLRAIGVNKAVLLFLVGKAFSSFTAPITLYLIVSRFTANEQGYYYTFSSLLGLSIFFELGLGVVITQYASHEYLLLSWAKDGSLEGDEVALSRVISLVKKSIKWYSIVMTLFIVCLIPAGIIFFKAKPESVSIAYVVPWITLIIFFGLNTCFIPVTSIIEGCGRIAEIQQLRIIQAIGSVICVWITILVGGRLIASSIEFVAYWFIILLWLFHKYKGLLAQIIRYKDDPYKQISWRKEVLPMQWRIAVSWLSAYFMNYTFVPLLFHYRTPVEAGKMGMSLKLSGFIYILSMAWINARVPGYGALVKNRSYKELDRIASRTTLQAICVGFVLTILMIIAIYILNVYTNKNYLDRILSLEILIIMCLANIAMMVNSSMGGYLRAHKQEPLMIASIFVAIITVIACLVSAKYYNANIMAIEYAVIQIMVALPLTFAVLTKKRRLWHSADIITEEIA